MGVSRQTAFTLMLLLAFSAIVPGSAGYLSVKMEAIGQAQQELRALENRLRHERLAARIRKAERLHRDRRLQPVTPREPAERSHTEQGTPSGPAALRPVAPREPAERPRTEQERPSGPAALVPSRERPSPERPPRAQRQDPQRLIAQWRADDEMAGEALGHEPWSSFEDSLEGSLERRGGNPRHRECDADGRETGEKSGFIAPDVIGPEPLGEFLLDPSQAETLAN